MIKNGYFGGTTKFILNFASYKTGSNLRYFVTLINIVTSLILSLAIILLHKGTFYTQKNNFLSTKFFPVVILMIQILYAIFNIFEYVRINKAQSNGRSSCKFGMELFSICFTMVLWLICIVYLLIDYNSPMQILTSVVLFCSLMIDYTTISCRTRGVSLIQI